MKRLLLLTATVALSIPAAMAQTVIYDNMTTSLDNNMPLLPDWRNDSAEAGDDVWMWGTERSVVELKVLFNYRGTIPGTFDAKIRFRNLDDLAQTPSDAFYESDLVTLPTVAGINEYTFAIPHITVPDHFVWSIQAYNRQGSVGEIGPAYYSPATIGFSDDFFWLSDMGSEWTAYSWGGDPYANFAARITTAPVPEPATLSVLAFGGLAILNKRRKSRNR